MRQTTKRTLILCFLACLMCMPMMASADVFAEYEQAGTRSAYHTDTTVNSRRTDHFLIRFGPKAREGFMAEQMFQGQLQFLENVYDTWQILGLRQLGGIDANTKYKTVIQPRSTWDGDVGGTAVSFEEGPQVPGVHVPCNALGYKSPNGCTPHEVGHGWQNQHATALSGGLPAMQSPGFTESLANWVMSLQLASYPSLWPAPSVVGTHPINDYNVWGIFSYFMEAPGYGAPFINKLIFDPNLNDMGVRATWINDDIVRKAIRCDTSGSGDPAAAIHDGLGMMNAKMLDMDFWNHRVDRTYTYDMDTSWAGYFFNRVPLVKQPGVTDWYRPEWTTIPQSLSNNYIPLTVTATGFPRTVTCDFRPVSDAVRGSSFRACFIAYNQNKEPRYSKVWSAGENSFTLADDETAVYLGVMAVPKAIDGTLTNNDYTSDNVAMFPYRVKFTGATPEGFQWAAPTSGFHYHSNGGGIVANTASVATTAYVGPNAMVLGSAKVYGNARIEDYAVVDSNAVIGRSGMPDDPVISGHAYVTGTAQVYGHAKVREYAWVFSNAKIYDNAIVLAHTMKNGGSAYGNSVLGMCQWRETGLSDKANYGGSAILAGDNALWQGGSESIVTTQGVVMKWSGAFTGDSNYQYLAYNFETKSAIFAMDQYCLNHGYLMGEPQVISDTISGTTTNVLDLNGTNQYVELKPEVADFADITVSAWVKWTGSTNDQKIFSAGNGTNKYMYLTPKDATTGKLRFVISNGTATQYLDGTAPLTANTWTHVAVTLSGDTGVLYVNGTAVDTDAAITINPDQLHAPLMEDANYIGRGNAGDYFQGRIDQFVIRTSGISAADIVTSKTVIGGAAPAADSAAPTPTTATWLVAPTALANGSITMSATEGTDAGNNGVLYYFRCVNDPTHDSGWVSENTYKDCKAAPGASYTYAVKMKDKLGNTGTESAQLSATAAAADITAPTPNAPSFAYGPKGSASNAITMTAVRGTDADETVLYKFTRVGTSITSGWTSSPTWTDKGLTSGASYSYTLQMKDGHGNATAIATSAATAAKDVTPPTLDADFRMQWDTYPYTQLDKTVRMYARVPAEAGIEYYYECIDNTAVNSGWTTNKEWITSPLTDGLHSFHFKIRDAAHNESAWSATKTAKVLTTNSWHDYTLAQLSGLPDDTLVRFTGKVTQVNVGYYIVSTPDNSVSIKVVPRAFGYQTDPTLLNQNVNVKGHLWTYTGSPKCVTSGIVAGNPQTGKIEFENCDYDDDLARPLYDVDASGCEYLGWYQTGWSISVPNVAASTRISVAYSGGGRISMYMNGSHYKDLDLPNSTGWGSATFTGLSIPAGATLRFQQDQGDSSPNLDFIIVGAAYAISGKVTDNSGAAISGATVYLSSTPSSRINPTFITYTDTLGNYSKIVPAGTWYVSASANEKAYYSSADQTVAVSSADATNVNFTLQAIAREFPRPDDLLASCVTDMLPDDGMISTWPSYQPLGINFSSKWGAPTVEYINGQKWAKNVAGWSTPDYASAVPANGATIVAAVKPVRVSGNQAWPSTISVFFDRLSFGIQNSDGRVQVKRNGDPTWASAAIPDGQMTIMSLVAQPNGQYKLYANGTQILSVTTTSDMTSLVPGVPGGYAKTLTIGSNGPDGWSALNGYIGDVAIYKVALTDAERQTLEGTMAAKFGVGIPSYTINASAGTGGTISPSGAYTAYKGTTPTFTITPQIGYVVADVKVDNVSVGAVETYTFPSVQAAHTISATFRSVPTYTITASSGSGGGVNPNGTVVVNAGSNKTFNIVPLDGYAVKNVIVDGTSVGAVPSYTFSNIAGNHTISATFSIIPTTIAGKVTASANGAVVSGATIYFSLTANASANPAYTTTTDADGNYSKELPPGTWYVAAGKTGLKTSNDQTAEAPVGVTVTVNFALSPSSDVYYKFNETAGTTAADSSGSNKNGTLINGPVWAAGRLGNCLSFDGTNDYVTVPDLVDFSALTVAGWVNLDTLGTDSTGSAIFACDGATAGDAQFLILKGTGKMRFSLIGNTAADNDSTYAFTSADFGKWRHVAVVYDSVAKTVKFYINGKLDSTKTLTTARTALLTGGLRIGSWSGGRYFDGKIDEFHIYEKALNATEIAALVNSSPSMRIADAKKLANGEVVTLADKLVTYAPRNASGTRATPYFYIEEADRSSGILVQDASGYQDDLNIDTPVTVSGVMKTSSYNGQRYLDLTALPGSGTAGVVNPLGMATKSVQNDMATLALLVRVAGKVVEISDDKIWFTMMDGYGVPTIVICETTIPLSGFAVGDTVVVTGVVGRDIVFGSSPEGIIYPRSIVKL